MNLNSKTIALLALGVLSLLAPILEKIFTGKVEPMSSFDLGATLLALVLVFWWYHLDKDEMNYQAGRLMNAGVIAVCIVALPVYFVRSRGWKRGLIAIAVAGAVLLAGFGLTEIGERIAANVG